MLDGELTAVFSSRLLRSTRPDTLVAEIRKQPSSDLQRDIRELNRRIADSTADWTVALLQHDTFPTKVAIIGIVLAARVLTHTDSIEKLLTVAQYAPNTRWIKPSGGDNYCSEAEQETSARRPAVIRRRHERPWAGAVPRRCSQALGPQPGRPEGQEPRGSRSQR